MFRGRTYYTVTQLLRSDEQVYIASPTSKPSPYKVQQGSNGCKHACTVSLNCQHVVNQCACTG